jgi:hypothetical protein
LVFLFALLRKVFILKGDDFPRFYQPLNHQLLKRLMRTNVLFLVEKEAVSAELVSASSVDFLLKIK